MLATLAEQIYVQNELPAAKDALIDALTKNRAELMIKINTDELCKTETEKDPSN